VESQGQQRTLATILATDVAGCSRAKASGAAEEHQVASDGRLDSCLVRHNMLITEEQSQGEAGSDHAGLLQG
jgi:hypothetical protein